MQATTTGRARHLEGFLRDRLRDEEGPDVRWAPADLPQDADVARSSLPLPLRMVVEDLFRVASDADLRAWLLTQVEEVGAERQARSRQRKAEALRRLAEDVRRAVLRTQREFSIPMRRRRSG